MDLAAFFADFPTLATPRLTLRQWSPADAEDATAIFGDPDVARHTAWAALVERLGVAQFLAIGERMMAAREIAFWAIVPRDTGHVAGFVSFHPLVPDDRRAELGYALARRYWGRGYAREAVRAAIDCAFTRLGCNRVEAHVTVENSASSRVLERLGLRHEGTLREHTVIGGQPRDRAVYAILRADWPAKLSDPALIGQESR